MKCLITSVIVLALGITVYQLLNSLSIARAQPISEGRGRIELPYLYGDTGMVALQAGSVVTVTWEDAPPGGIVYVFIWKSLRAEKPWRIMGSNFDPSDGVSIAWKVPEFIGGVPFGVALAWPRRLAVSAVSALQYGSGKAPPEGICTVSYSGLSGLPEVFTAPPNDGASSILGYLSDYAPVQQRYVDGEGFPWLQVDLTPPGVISRLDEAAPLPESGWIYAVNVRLLGECSGLSE
jgi:hypothetical protein